MFYPHSVGKHPPHRLPTAAACAALLAPLPHLCLPLPNYKPILTLSLSYESIAMAESIQGV